MQGFSEVIDTSSARIERVRYCGVKAPYQEQFAISCGKARRLPVKAGDIISRTNVDGGNPLLLTAHSDGDRNFTAARLGLADIAAQLIDSSAFDAREVGAELEQRDGDGAHRR